MLRASNGGLLRRQFAAICVAALVAASCSDGGLIEPAAPTDPESTSSFTEAPTTTVAETTTSEAAPPTLPAIPARGGSVVIADDQEPPTLNPLVEGGDNFITSIIGQAHLAGVYDIEATTLDLIPELVVEIPSVGNGGVTVNEDGTMTVRYQIRDEAVWSDGVPISGADLEFTLSLILDPGYPGDKTTYEDVTDWKTDAKTFELTLSEPSVEYELLFPVVVPRHAVVGSDFANDWNDVMWPAAGPFELDEWQKGKHLRLVRNENYWKTDPNTGIELPYLDSVEFRFIPETDSILYAFTQREVDVIQPPPFTPTIERLEELEPAGADVQVRVGPVWEHLSFQFGPGNRNPDSLNEYTAFRQAIAYAIDPEVVAPLVGWIPINSILQLGRDDGPWSQYGHDPDRAADLLAEACELASRDCDTEPPKVVFSTTSNADARPRMAEYLKSALTGIGIDIELQLEDSQLFFGETLNDGTWDLGSWAWVGTSGAAGAVGTLDLFDPDDPAPDGSNFYRWGTSDSSVRDDAVDRFRDLLAIVRQTVDPAESAAVAQAAEQILAENVVIIPVGGRRVLGAVWADEIAGFEMNPSQASHTWNIESWWRVDL